MNGGMARWICTMCLIGYDVFSRNLEYLYIIISRKALIPEIDRAYNTSIYLVTILFIQYNMYGK